MRIIHISAEIAPVAKEGGLGDVVYGLSRETNKRGHPTSIIIPFYDILEIEELEDLFCSFQNFPVKFAGQQWNNRIWTATVGNLKVYFIDPDHPARFFSRGTIYGCHDDVERFLYFSKASLDFSLAKMDADLIHLHDWPTAIIGALANEEKTVHKKEIPPILLTIHNMDYQGRCAPWEINKIGLDPQNYYLPDLMQDSLYPEALNLLRGGIIYSQAVTTVSPSYCKETRETYIGEGLEELLKGRQEKYSGIINGIDFDYWNPKTDKHLPSHYSTETAQKFVSAHHSIEGKKQAKMALQERLKLDPSEPRPIIGVVSRLVPQKGVHIILHAIRSVVEKGGQFALLGSSQNSEIQQHFEQIQRECACNPHIGLNLKHEERLAHMIFAGSDIFIVPSNFEPCGLTQMIALRYGTIPIVRKTGGLKDTIYDRDNDSPEEEKAAGFTFEDPTPEAFDQALGRAIGLWRNHPGEWRKLMLQGMNHDYSWKKPAQEYLQLYNSLLSVFLS